MVTNHVVILQPKHDVDKTNSDQTFKLFKMTIDQNILLEKKIKIKSKKFTSKGRVVLTCGSKEQCEDLCKSMEKNLAVQAKVPVKKNPLIQILGVDELVSKENVKMITSQNDLEEYSECKFDVKRSTDLALNSSLQKWILSYTRSLFRLAGFALAVHPVR